MKIGTWNVQSMYESGKIHNTIQEMKRLNISLLGISEMRWPGSGRIKIEDHVVYYSGEDSTRHSNGVAFILTNEMDRAVKNCLTISDRVILLQIQAKPAMINFIQVYAPTSTCTEEEIEQFYVDLNIAMNKLKSNSITVLMGDLNAKVGCGKEGSVVGSYGLGVRNERGDKFVQFCVENDLAIMNTFFKLPKRRLYTWKAPGDSKDHIIRNQIDFITVKQRYKNSIKFVKTYPGADVPSDHRLLMANILCRFERLPKPRYRVKLDLDKLSNPTIRDNVMNLIEKDIETIQKENLSAERKYESFATTIKNSINTYLKPDKTTKKKSWMTDEILKLMEDRRQWKVKGDDNNYRRINAEIRRKVRNAKSRYFSQECEEIEEYDRRHDNFHIHKKIKEIVGLKPKKHNTNIKDKDGQLILEIEDKLIRWKEYIQDLFEDQRKDEHKAQEKISGPPITINEIEKAIQMAKNKKATGPDEIPSEILKILGKNATQLLKQIFNTIYDGGFIPSDWLRSTFIPIPKKHNAKECKDHRTISLMSHVLKIFLRIIHQRIYKKIEEHIADSQFGFRKGLGTREALFSIQVLIQRCRDVNTDVFMCFVDLEKAFDKVQHDKMVDILKTTSIDDKDLHFIANLYWRQTANLKMDNDFTEDIAIKRGVRQGCILSPLLFNLYSEAIFKEACLDSPEGIKVNGIVMNNIRYADDTVLMANSIEDLQSVLDRVVHSCEQFGLKLNITKTKFMIVSKRNINTQLWIGQNRVERTEKIVYLGQLLSDDWDHSKEIKRRIEIARNTFIRMKKILCGRDLSLTLRMRMVRCYVFSVLLYGVESWTLTENTMKKLEAFELWTYRRMLRISWIDHVTNVEVMKRMGKDKEVINTVKTRKLSYFGHVMRHPEIYNILHLVLQGKVEGKRGPGRRRISWLKNLRQWFGQSTSGLFRAAVNKVKIVNMIANIR